MRNNVSSFKLLSVNLFFRNTKKNEQIQTLNNQIDLAQEQINNITSPIPRLISLGMAYKDNRTNPGTPFLEVTGYVVNVGTGKANNCTLLISAIQNGNGTAIDKSVPIDPVEAGNYQKIDLQIAYTGEPLVAYSANLEWEA